MIPKDLDRPNFKILRNSHKRVQVGQKSLPEHKAFVAPRKKNCNLFFGLEIFCTDV